MPRFYLKSIPLSNQKALQKIMEHPDIFEWGLEEYKEMSFYSIWLKL